MKDKEQLARKQTMKSLKAMMITLLACFFAGPFVLWKNISQFDSTVLTGFLILHIITFSSLFLFFMRRYRKVAKKNLTATRELN
jgi:hypothetical protein